MLPVRPNLLSPEAGSLPVSDHPSSSSLATEAQLLSARDLSDRVVGTLLQSLKPVTIAILWEDLESFQLLVVAKQLGFSLDPLVFTEGGR